MSMMESPMRHPARPASLLTRVLPSRSRTVNS